jgi:hypothetical protein
VEYQMSERHACRRVHDGGQAIIAAVTAAEPEPVEVAAMIEKTAETPIKSGAEC